MIFLMTFFCVIRATYRISRSFGIPCYIFGGLFYRHWFNFRAEYGIFVLAKVIFSPTVELEAIARQSVEASRLGICDTNVVLLSDTYEELWVVLFDFFVDQPSTHFSPPYSFCQWIWGGLVTCNTLYIPQKKTTSAPFPQQMAAQPRSAPQCQRDCRVTVAALRQFAGSQS